MEMMSMEVALIGSAVISWIAVAMALTAMVRVRKQANVTEKFYRRLSHDLQVANSGSLGMGKRLMTLERALSDAKRKQADLESKTDQQKRRDASVAEGDSLAFTQASMLLNAGLEADDVAKRCGLSRAEASLMQLMQVQSANSGPVAA